MPRKPIDYSKTLFYRLVCRDTTVKECYVGHTCNEVKRRNGHKSRCTNEKSNKYNLYVYRFIREHGSWSNWELIVIEKLPVNNRIEAAIRERYWVEFYEAKLNKQIPSRPQKEYRAKYIIDHDEKIKEVSAKYRVDNIEKIKEYQNTKHTCTCGGHYTTANRSYHLKTKKHTSFKATE